MAFIRRPLLHMGAPIGQLTGIRDALKCIKCAPLWRAGAHVDPQAPLWTSRTPLFRIEAPLKTPLFRPETPL